jgi:hypothetical protein
MKYLSISYIVAGSLFAIGIYHVYAVLAHAVLQVAR